MSRIEPRTFRGTRDFLPSELIPRRRIVSIIEEAYRRYGFQPLETPAIEYLEILTGKSEENDKLIYEIRRARGDAEDSAESAIALRYDLTVPLARVVAQYAELPRPFKRYQIQPVWRADRPQPRQGRYREFVQCDADILGTDSPLADAEIVALTSEVLTALKFEKYRIRLSSRKFLAGLSELVTGNETHFFDFCRCLDKLDKIGWDGVEQEFGKNNIPAKDARARVTELMASGGTEPDFAGARKLVAGNGAAEVGLNEIETVYHAARDLGVPQGKLSFDATLARGLDYYTGPIFETVSEELPHLGSLTGGGRYDGLVATFSKQNVPATGTTIGLDRIQTALTQLERFKSEPSETQVLVARFDDAGVGKSLELAAELRRAGLRAEIWYDNDRMKKQFSYADQQQIPFVVIAGPDERERGEVSLKNLRTQEQVTLAQSDLAAHLLNVVKAQAGSPDSSGN
ncbi:MAG: histidine--tRNA ligase [Calditrichaeota bacterium]|nr:histidine--tRNA ligase [Calditrichota bacterium]MCB9391538.1 histidine--tRNA ligase [Calditrichota bacterium]